MPLDIYEEVNNLIVKAALPGLKPDEVTFQVEDDILTISGVSKQEYAGQERNYQLREQFYGRLERSVALSESVAAEKAEAVFADGVLTLTLPKAETVRAKQNPIKAAQ
jgi:HSP20 family protein